MYEKLSKLVIEHGLNVQKEQPVLIRAAIRDAEFVHMLVEDAYKIGASKVEVDWRDEELTKMHYIYQSKGTLEEIQDWIRLQAETRAEKNYAYLSVVSDAPGGLKGVDMGKVNAHMAAQSKALKKQTQALMNNDLQWCIIGVPSLEWAKVVFPDLSDEQAFERLEQAIFSVTRVTEENDPIEEWKKHDEELIQHAKQMTDHHFQSLHFQNSLGTDLNVELVKNHIWEGGGSTSNKGVFFDPNMPTEEIFTMPKRDGVNGVVYASKPLSYNGKVIEDFWFRFENGAVVDFGAKKEQETLEELLKFDEGAKYLGEVALVPYDSPISKSNILFFETLYDENAACHLALGACYPENIVGGIQMSEEELLKHGGNHSDQHEDFMFGTSDLSVDGIQEDGTIIPVFRNGNFVI